MSLEFIVWYIEQTLQCKVCLPCWWCPNWRISFDHITSIFFGSPKHHLGFTKLVEIMEIEGLKVLWNVKTRWINMLAPFKKFGKDYKTLIAIMVVDNGIMEASKANLVNLCDVGKILGLPCVLPMLESINALMKFAKLICTKCTMIPPLHPSLKILD